MSTAKWTAKEKLWMLKGMILTRAVDNALKHLFISGEMQYQGKGFQGKGFRSLGQEAIYAAALKLKYGKSYSKNGTWAGDVVGPLIRDLGIMLAFSDDDVEQALNAQVGKAGPPLDGKDLHNGDLSCGVLPAAAPLSIATCTVTGMAFAMRLKKEKRVGVSFIGDGGSSLGEWHEAINLAAVNQLPMIFCVQNNQTALSTPIKQQSKARTFADKAIGYGIPAKTLDGTDPEAIAAAFAWGADHARKGLGPVLIELISMRMCGHAHHDDMLYLGKDPELSFELPKPQKGGYVDGELFKKWAKKDPLKTYAAKLIREGVCKPADVERFKTEALERCRKAVAALKERPWPAADEASKRVFAETKIPLPPFASPLGGGKGESSQFSPKGMTYLEGICLATREIMEGDSRVFMLGEDIGAPYGNAFMVFKPLMKDLGERFINTPIAEGAIVGAAVGMALEGLRPIAEMQFNDFVASGFNQVVNNAAKFFFRTGTAVPMVLRMPWGGLRRAGPYHSQDTSPWFYRTPGLKIVAPSTPSDARALLHAAVNDGNPVLYYEHIALYRDPSIRQELTEKPEVVPIGKAAIRRSGSDLSLISYGAYVHRAMHCADVLAKDGIECDVLDLRTLMPLDLDAIWATVRRTGKVLLVGEDTKTGSILESIASQIGETCFMDLDGPVRVLGSLDTPVPYSPPLEDAFLLSNKQIITAAMELAKW